MNAEGAGRCDCETTLNIIFSILAVGKSTQILGESKCHTYPQEGQEEEPRELQIGQLHHSHWEGDGTANPGNHFQAHEGEENHR